VAARKIPPEVERFVLENLPVVRRAMARRGGVTRITIDVTGSGQVALEFNGECAVWIEADGQRIRVMGNARKRSRTAPLRSWRWSRRKAQLVLAKGAREGVSPETVLRECRANDLVAHAWVARDMGFAIQTA